MCKHATMTVLAGGLALLALSCRHSQENVPYSAQPTEESAIRQADLAWSRMAEAKDVDGVVACFLESGVMQAPNQPKAVGREAIRKSLAEMFALPGFAVRWWPTKVEVARSGDLGYSMGMYELSMNDPKGAPCRDRGKYVTLWKKKSDGTWKVAVDTFNSDLPAAQPTE